MGDSEKVGEIGLGQEERRCTPAHMVSTKPLLFLGRLNILHAAD